jgi:ribosomal protein S24E
MAYTLRLKRSGALSLQIVKESRNDLLGRREVDCIFNSMAGSLKRQDAVSMVAKGLNIDVKKIHLISLRTNTGTRDVSGLFYIYDKPEDAKKQLPEYLSLRMLTKEEREKLIKEAKKKEPAKEKKAKGS